MLNLIFRLYRFGPRKKHLPMNDASIPWFPALLCRLVNEVQHQQERTDSPKDHLKVHPFQPTYQRSNWENTPVTGNTKEGFSARVKFQTIVRQIRQTIVEKRKADKTSALGKAYQFIRRDESANPDGKGRRGSWLGEVQQRVAKVSHDLPETVRSTLKHVASRESTRRSSLLPSGLDLTGIKNRFTLTNKNSNANEKFCQICFTKDCQYRGDPGRMLLEAQLSAARYKYIGNSTADAFLTRRPVLSDYALVENFLQGNHIHVP